MYAEHSVRDHSLHRDRAGISPDDRKTMSRRGIQQWASDGNDPPEEIFSDDYVNHQESDVRAE